MSANVQNYFFELMQVALGNRESLSGVPTAEEWEGLYDLAREQAVVGVLLDGIKRLPTDQLPQKTIRLQWIGVVLMVQQQNEVMDRAVARLCQKLDAEGLRYVVIKGQTLNVIYDSPGVRQSGDIDFMVHPDDWDKAYGMFEDALGKEAIESHSVKHVEWKEDGIQYEMHRMLTSFASSRHQRYWDEVVMKGVWENPCHVEIEGVKVPTLAPTYNVLYVFVHVFYHLIIEGVGLRQFVDWFILLHKTAGLDADLLETHLEGIGLKKAFTGLGTVLTDYLGMPEKEFPFEIGDAEHKAAPKLISNILKGGNFGHNKQYAQAHGVIHAMQQFGRVAKQVAKFHRLAPSETWLRLPQMWWHWCLKVGSMVRK